MTSPADRFPLRAGLALAGLALAAPLAASADEATTAVRATAAAIRLGDFARAQGQVAIAIAAAPDSGMAQALAARIALARGDGLAAEAALDRAVRAGMAPTRLIHLRAHAKLVQGKTEEAAALAAAPMIPARYRTYALRIAGRAAAVDGDLAAAGRAFGAAIRRTPGDAASWTDFARYRLMVDDQPGAVASVDNALRLDPRLGEALVLKGEIERRVYGLAAALPWFETAVDLDPLNGAALVELAAIHGDMGQYGAMLDTARRAAGIRQSRPRALYLQAVLAARARDYDLARAIVLRIGGSLGDMPGMLLLSGGLDYQTGAYDQAIAKLADLIERQPANADARRLLAAAQVAAGDARSALDVLAPLVERADPDAYALALAGRAMEALGQRDRAGQLLDAAVRPSRGTVDGAADVAAAEGLARRLPASVDAQLRLGDALIAAGDPRAAADAFARAGNLRFDETSALRLVDALARAGRRRDARETLDLFLQQNPNNLAALKLVADWQIAAGEWPGAVATLESLRRRVGNRDGALLAQLAWAHAGAGDPARALIYAEAAYELAPGSPMAADTYGWLLAAVPDRRRDALALLDKAVALAPDNAAIRAHRDAVARTPAG